jgi:hypothetical protein
MMKVVGVLITERLRYLGCRVLIEGLAQTTSCRASSLGGIVNAAARRVAGKPFRAVRPRRVSGEASAAPASVRQVRRAARARPRMRIHPRSIQFHQLPFDLTPQPGRREPAFNAGRSDHGREPGHRRDDRSAMLAASRQFLNHKRSDGHAWIASGGSARAPRVVSQFESLSA